MPATGSKDRHGCGGTCASKTPSAVPLRRLAGIVLADALHQTLPVRAISRDRFSSIGRVLSRPRGRR
jgi:hypothetical protein